MALRYETTIDLPAHRTPGGFDHAAVHRASARLYVAHTANDAVEVLDCATGRYPYAIPNLTGVAGAPLFQERHLVFSPKRGRHTVGYFAPDNEAGLAQGPVWPPPQRL